MQKDNKIFIYLRLRDGDNVLLKSRVREFTAIGKSLAEFMATCWDRVGKQTIAQGSLEFVEANRELVLISFKNDLIRARLIISGIIPPEYQERMLNPDSMGVKYSVNEFVERAGKHMDYEEKYQLQERLSRSPYNVLELIKSQLNENGEFYVAVDLLQPPSLSL